MCLFKIVWMVKWKNARISEKCSKPRFALQTWIYVSRLNLCIKWPVCQKFLYQWKMLVVVFGWVSESISLIRNMLGYHLFLYRNSKIESWWLEPGQTPISICWIGNIMVHYMHYFRYYGNFRMNITINMCNCGSTLLMVDNSRSPATSDSSLSAGGSTIN